uniref:KilA-N domain-containing protein n=1 Tax=viral metagenome TaxID=1070528 RepID=A0A6C0H3G9_9ZZZZ
MTTADLKNHQLPNNRLEVFKSNITKVDDNFFNCPLTLTNGDTMNIPMRNDGYINATLLCTAGGKLFSNWYQNKQTKDLINALESDKENSKNKEILNAGIPVFKSIQVTKGRYGGSWIHPDLAIQLAQWISLQFAIKFLVGCESYYFLEMLS